MVLTIRAIRLLTQDKNWCLGESPYCASVHGGGVALGASANNGASLSRYKLITLYFCDDSVSILIKDNEEEKSIIVYITGISKFIFVFIINSNVKLFT